MTEDVNEPLDGGSDLDVGAKRRRVSTAALDERMSQLEARMSELDARERELDARAAELQVRMEMAPREREERISTRSRAVDESARLERQSMDYYSPPSQMETPRDDVYYYRWIRESVNGYATPASIQKRIRDGFERVKMSDLPEDFVVDEDDRGDGYARNSGLILMRIPQKRKDAIDRYYLGKSVERLQSADELQGIAKRDYVREDRGSGSFTGRDAQQVLSHMSQT